MNDREDEGFVIVRQKDEDSIVDSQAMQTRDRERVVERVSGNDIPKGTLQGQFGDIDRSIDRMRAALWELNISIHENPELAFEERKAHKVLTDFMSRQNGWQVTTSAYGMETAWVAVYDSGNPGPAVSFNAEMGKRPQSYFHKLLIPTMQMLCPS